MVHMTPGLSEPGGGLQSRTHGPQCRIGQAELLSGTVDRIRKKQGDLLLRTLPQQIAENLTASILSGEIKAGSRLREVEFATFYEVSRSTIREALRILELRGLVEIRVQKGAYVTHPSRDEIYKLFAVRASLLATASRLAAEVCTPEQATLLHARLDKLAANLNDATAYVHQSGEMIDLITTIAGNEILKQYADDLATRIGRYVPLGLAALARRKKSLKVWKQTIDAIVSHKPDKASANHYLLATQNRDAALLGFDQLQAQ